MNERDRVELINRLASEADIEADIFEVPWREGFGAPSLPIPQADGVGIKGMSRKWNKRLGYVSANVVRHQEAIPGRWRKTKKRGCDHVSKTWTLDHRFDYAGRPSNWWNLVCDRCRKTVDYCIWRRVCKCGHHAESKAA